MNKSRHLLSGTCMLVASLLSFSCGEPEFIGPEQLLVTMKGNNFTSSCGYINTKIVITDLEGRVLAATDFNGELDKPIYGPVPADTHSINLYIVQTDEISAQPSRPDYYNVTGYLALKAGTDFSGLPVLPATTPNRQVEIASTLMAFDNLVLSSDVAQFSFTRSIYNPLPDYNPVPDKFLTSSGILFTQVVSNGEGRYGFTKVDESVNRINLDVASINTPSTKLKFAPKDIVSGYTISISGSFSKSGPMTDKFFIYRNPSHVESNVYYPASVFARYSTELNYAQHERTYREVKTAAQPDFDFKLIEFDATVVNRDPKNFSMDVTGDFDYYRAIFSNNLNASITVYGRRCDASFRLPDFSQVAGLQDYASGIPNSFNVTLFDHKALQEDVAYFKHFSSAYVDIECNDNMRTVTLPPL